jgi:hypothetical protein
MNQDFEKELFEIDEIKEWSLKLIKIKELKLKINNQKNKMTNLLQVLGEAKKIKKKKDLTIEELLKEFEDSNNLEEKVKLFSHIQYLIKESELELFDEDQNQ